MIKSLHIVFLAPASNIHSRRWVEGLAGRGYRISLISLKDHQHTIPFSKGIMVYYLPFPTKMGYFLNIPHLKKLLKKLAPDIVHAHYASGYGTLGRLSRQKPLLLSVWGSDVYDFPEESAWKRKLIIKNLTAADYLASTSHCMAKQTKKYCGEREIAITPFGIDINLFKPDKEEKKGRVIGIVKTLAWKYGVDILIRAFAALKREFPELKLHIIGDGPMREELQDLAQDLAISSNCHFLGRQEHQTLPAFLNKMDIFCAPSRLDSESFGVAALEAMACSLPVVCSDADGFREVVPAEKAGFIVPKENVNALQEQLRRLIIDAELRKNMGAEGRNHIMKNYSWDKSLDLMDQLYKKIINQTS